MAVNPKVKLKALVNFPAKVEAENFLTITKEAGVFTIGVDYTKLVATPITDPTTAIIAVFDEVTGAYAALSVADIVGASFSIEQHITGPGPVVIQNATGVVRVDQAVGAPITLQMGLADDKTVPVLISDWKGDAGTNNITIQLTGSDKFPGGLTSWKIAGDGGSVFLRPVAGVGYAL
ncbi:hypothetical protein JQ633_01105 [Bradyrhizobium tropiciagri]|uniref:hypothetical protein n=1 Tax=Bradyrhizobium tropiciagri TaxID=312253 RepID=UPI001BA9876E|nr:hypothetical protein [Bradyrhizobium tropiciagri]MBR0868939.1 hypothetical protein [Bradyrhizobium tropiciagri]